MPENTQVSRLRASAHPVRLRILSLLTGAEMSAAEVARELDLTHANASYHLRTLADVGLLEIAGEERIRGGVAKRYRHPWADSDAGEGRRVPTTQEWQGYVRASAEELVRRADVAADHRERHQREADGQREANGQRERRKGYSSDAEMWVEPEVWDRVFDLLQEAGALIHANARPPRTPGTLHVNQTVFAFVMGDLEGEGEQ